MVSPDEASKDQKWWQDDRYAIYDLNVNSAAVYPQHNEELDLSSAGPTYTTKGYAYAGGGRRITRVEISLDKGKCMENITVDDEVYSVSTLTQLIIQLGVWQISNTPKTTTEILKGSCSVERSTCTGVRVVSVGASGPWISQSPNSKTVLPYL